MTNIQNQLRSNVEAERLAEILEQTDQMYPNADVSSAEVAAELRRQHNEIKRLHEVNKELLEALQIVVTIAKKAFDHWDADHDAKVGKILLALSGISQRYDKRIDAIHSAIAKASGLAT